MMMYCENPISKNSEDWIIAQKQRVNPNGLATYYGVKRFFDANEIELN